jgi:prepilin-type N-terminal cleavage/methylation domain-containing protein
MKKIFFNKKIMKKLNQKKAFTLVELIVVITILAILATVAFMYWQTYVKDTRDAVRITDI